MNKVLGIVAEYNPFHNGHLYHLRESKKITGSTYTVTIISGNYTQRGSTALIDKWSRAEIALKNGIDLVLELPVVYATSSAENFADGAIKILNSMKLVNYLSFGAETADVKSLQTIAEILYKEPKEYKNYLAKELQAGQAYPKAREKALFLYLNKDKKYLNIISLPNNILGIEYLKALKKYNSNIEPIAIPRLQTNHKDLNYSKNMASSTAIRNIIKNHKFDIAQKLMPKGSYLNILKNLELGHVVSDLCVFEHEIIYKLRSMSTYEISLLPDVTEGLEFLIKKAANSCNNIKELINIVKSKRYTSTRIYRILLYALLDIYKKDINLSKQLQPYIRVLGFNEHGKDLISQISKANPELNIITSVKKFVNTNNNNNLKTMLDKDIFATDIYTIGYTCNSFSNLDFTHKIISI